VSSPKHDGWTDPTPWGVIAAGSPWHGDTRVGWLRHHIGVEAGSPVCGAGVAGGGVDRVVWRWWSGAGIVFF
jgi:hypothetical protein